MSFHPVSNKNPQIVFLYSSKNTQDNNIRKGLETHVSGLNHLSVSMNWYDLSRDIIYFSDNINNDNFNILSTADIVALLVSPDFIHLIHNTPLLYNQIQKHIQNEDITVVPLLIRPCSGWERDFPNLAPLPKDGAFVSSGKNRDEVFCAITKGLEDILENKKKYKQNLHEYKNIFLKTI
jgi:hypothetical protein